jgi:predicted nucleic acid-binding protein
MGRTVTTPLLFDTSVYVAILRNAAFAATFRPRYVQDMPLTYFSSVVVQELLAGAHTPRQRRQVAALYEPFERVRRIVTPSHLVWKEVGNIVAALLEKTPQFRSKLTSGLLNDTLIALSGRAIGARVVTSNGQDFHLIQQFRAFVLEVIELNAP